MPAKVNRVGSASVALNGVCTSMVKSKTDFRAAVSALLSCAILIGGIFAMGITAYLVTVSYSSLPYADGWDEVGAAAYGSSQLNPAWLWAQHNEHRVVLQKIL